MPIGLSSFPPSTRSQIERRRFLVPGSLNTNSFDGDSPTALLDSTYVDIDVPAGTSEIEAYEEFLRRRPPETVRAYEQAMEHLSDLRRRQEERMRGELTRQVQEEQYRRTEIENRSRSLARQMEDQMRWGSSASISRPYDVHAEASQPMTAFRSGLNTLIGKFKGDQKDYLFGLEFEAFKPEGTELEFVNTAFGTDGSISPPDGFRGFEFRMEPMEFDKSHTHVKKLLKYVKENGSDVNKSCGFHTHVSHPIFFDATFIKKLMFFWIAIEDVIMSTQPHSRMSNFYCKRYLFQYINDYGHDIPRAKDELISDMSRKDRYSALNLTALQKHGTIEVRLHAGTLDEDKIINWTIFLKSIFDYVKDSYNSKVVKGLFDEEVGDEKIAKVFKLLKLPEEVSKFYTERIQKFGWRRLRSQTRLAKECILMQQEKATIEKEMGKVQKKLASKIKKLRGEAKSFREGRQNPASFSGVTPSYTNTFVDPGSDFVQQYGNVVSRAQAAMGSIGASGASGTMGSRWSNSELQQSVNQSRENLLDIVRDVTPDGGALQRLTGVTA